MTEFPAIHSYRIEVVTGSFNRSGTNSSISLTLFSCVTSDGLFLLDGPGDDFEQGSTGTYYNNLMFTQSTKYGELYIGN